MLFYKKAFPTLGEGIVDLRSQFFFVDELAKSVCNEMGCDPDSHFLWVTCLGEYCKKNRQIRYFENGNNMVIRTSYDVAFGFTVLQAVVRQGVEKKPKCVEAKLALSDSFIQNNRWFEVEAAIERGGWKLQTRPLGLFGLLQTNGQLD